MAVGYDPRGALALSLPTVILAGYGIAPVVGGHHHQPVFVVGLLPILDRGPDFADIAIHDGDGFCLFRTIAEAMSDVVSELEIDP